MYDLQITHVPGKQMVQSDALSRWHTYGEGEEKEETTVLPDTMFAQDAVRIQANTTTDDFETEEEDSLNDERPDYINPDEFPDLDEIRKKIVTLTETDPDGQQIIQALENNTLPPLRTALQD